MSVQSITVFVVGGTGESSVDDDCGEVGGLLASVVAHLDHRFTSTWVSYPASYGPATSMSGLSYADSLAIGCANLARAFAGVDGPVMFLGYSQGAVVVRRFVAAMSSTDVRRVLGVGLVADPHQPAGAVAGCDGSGVAGPVGDTLWRRVPSYWIGDADDVICNASADSLVRDIADLTGALAVSGVGDLARWASSMLHTLRRNAFQNAAATSLSPAQWVRDVHRLQVAAREVAGYLPTALRWRGKTWRNPRGGRHTSYCGEPYRPASFTDRHSTGCEILARWMQVQATFAVGTAEWDPPETGDARTTAA